MLGLFDSKVDEVLAVSRWLYAVMAPQVEALLNSTFDKWARVQVGMPPWQSAYLAHWELGWGLSSFARAILDVASRSARIQAWPRGDWYVSSLSGVKRMPRIVGGAK